MRVQTICFVLLVSFMAAACTLSSGERRKERQQQEAEIALNQVLEQLERELEKADMDLEEIEDETLNSNKYDAFTEGEFKAVKADAIRLQGEFILWIDTYHELYGDDESYKYARIFKKCNGYLREAGSWPMLTRRLNDFDRMHREFTALPQHKPILMEKYDPEWKKTISLQSELYEIRNQYNLW